MGGKLLSLAVRFLSGLINDIVNFFIFCLFVMYLSLEAENT